MCTVCALLLFVLPLLTRGMYHQLLEVTSVRYNRLCPGSTNLALLLSAIILSIFSWVSDLHFDTCEVNWTIFEYNVK